MLLQTLRTRDFDELAGAFRQWNLRFRQFGRVPFWISSSSSAVTEPDDERLALARFGQSEVLTAAVFW